jgi:hypothetical protein
MLMPLFHTLPCLHELLKGVYSARKLHFTYTLILVKVCPLHRSPPG